LRGQRAPLRAGPAPTVTQTFDQATTGFNKINDYEFGTNSGWNVNNLTDLADHGLGKIILLWLIFTVDCASIRQRGWIRSPQEGKASLFSLDRS